jgi:hypothetical protein
MAWQSIKPVLNVSSFYLWNQVQSFVGVEVSIKCGYAMRLMASMILSPESPIDIGEYGTVFIISRAEDSALFF